ncbi:unnamed protein product [Soboliphyme baturini]|uniref:Secreted protein n=1 Tax=Soboliphyme baturini TaxID=241478 RepID=A0A183IEW4_9BILA|nr:unnamed protein product [Soboliphyme baturini]
MALVDCCSWLRSVAVSGAKGDFHTPPLPVPCPVEKGGGLKTVTSPRKIQQPAIHVTKAIENYTGSVVARHTKGRASCWGTEADCEKSAIKTSILSSSSRGGGSSTTTADDHRRNHDDDTTQQWIPYPF